MSSIDDIKNAPTYADALERASGFSYSYNIKKGRFSNKLSLFFIFILSIIFPAAGGFFPVGALIVLMVWIIWSGRTTKGVLLENGIVIIRRYLYPAPRIYLSDIRGVGFRGNKFFLFLSRGRRIALFKLSNMPARDTTQPPLDFFNLLHILSSLKAAEDAKYTSESGAEISVSLSESATYRRVPMLVIGLILLAPVYFAASAILEMIMSLEPIEQDIIILAAVAFPGLLGLVIFIDGVIRFIREYRPTNLVFSKNGIKISGKLFSYSDVPLYLYRGNGEISDPEAGIIMIWRKDTANFVIRPEMENFFTLPYLLKEWTPDTFSIIPINSTPPSFQSLPYKDFIWLRPEFPLAPYDQDNLDPREN